MVLASGMARVRAWACACVLTAIAALPWSVAMADGLSPALQHGVDWLGAQVQSDGTLTGESSSIALPLQAREETFVTLGQLATAPSALSAAIARNTDTNLAYRARRVIAAGANGASADADVAALLAQQNADGGWGVAAGYASNALDTAFALEALGAVHANAGSAVANALAYLAQARQIDGGYGVHLQSSVYANAHVLLGANAWSAQLPAATAVAGYARDALLAQRDATQTFGNVQNNALALRALVTQTTQATVLQPLSAALSAAQRSDGSWAGDPYQTALALQALWLASQPSTSPSSGAVQGLVVDQTSNAPIAGATLKIAGQTAATTSASDGMFTLGGIAPGGYTLTASAAGYADRSVTLQIAAGQTLNVGSIAMAPLATSASLGGVVKNSSGTPLQGVSIAVGTLAVLTDANGQYQLNGLAPGAVAISASAAGYIPVSTNATLVAGVRYTFSPTLYPSFSTPPGTAALLGVVVDGATHNPIAGATVALNGTTQTTDASGKFAFAALPIGAFSASVAATGYQSVVASGVLAAGSNDIGTIALSSAPTTSRLSGHVTDADTQAAIAGAVLTVQGQGLSATSDASGAYVIDGIAGASLNLGIAASGYASQVRAVSLPQIGNVILDISLTKPVQSGIRFSKLEMEESPVSPHDAAELDAQLANASASAATLTVQATVTDAQGNVQFVFLGNKSYGLTNLPVVVPANGTLDLPMRQGLLRQAPGAYGVHAQALDGNGLVVAEADTQFTVVAEALLGGGVMPNPPLAQIGSNQPIALTADLTNVGNQDIPAGTLDLTVVLANPDTTASTAPTSIVRQVVDGLPLNGARGLVADGAGNLYTFNSSDSKLLKIDSSGTVSVLYAFNPTLASQGKVTDNLARDTQGNFWIPTTDGTVYQITAQGVPGSPIKIASMNYLSSVDVAANGDFLATGTDRSANWQLVRRTAQGQETVLWSNGLVSPQGIVRDGAGGYVVTNSGDDSLVRVSASGVITPFASGAGLSSPWGVERDTQGNYYVANYGNGTVVKVSPSGQVSPFASGFTQPVDLRFDASGNLFVSSQGDNSIYRILPDGTSQPFARGLANQPEGMRYDAAGNLWIANDDGKLRKLDSAGNVTIASTALSGPRGMAIDAAGGVLVANASSGTVSKTAGGVTTTFASGLSVPYGVAVDDGGRVYVTERGANRIRVFDASGAALAPVVSAVSSPSEVHVGAAGEVYILNNNHIAVVAGGTPASLIDGFSAKYLAADPVHGGVVAAVATDVYRIAPDGSKTHLNSTALPFSNNGVGVDVHGDVLLLDYYNQRIQKLDASGNLSIYATLPLRAQKFATDLAGHAYICADDNVTLLAIDTDGTVRPLPQSTGETISLLATAQDGHVLIQTNLARIYAIDPVSGATTRLNNNSGGTNGIAQDAAGRVYVADQTANEVRVYDAGGAQQSSITGFAAPKDIVWTGSDLKFVDNGNYFYALTPGGYPVRLGSFAPTYLTVSNGQVYGARPATGIERWNGSAGELYIASDEPSFFTGGIAARADGALTAANYERSRVVTYDASKNVIGMYAGLIQPTGLAFDSKGRLYVANYGARTVGRFDVGSAVPSVFAHNDVSPRFIAVDGSDNVWISYNTDLERVDQTGVATRVTDKVAYDGLMIAGTTILATDPGRAEVLSFDGSNWNALAAGLAWPTSVSAAPNGDVYVANTNNGTVGHYSNGTMGVAGGSIPGVNAVAASADGGVYAGTTGGALYQIAADGSRTDLRVAGSVNSMPWFGIAPAGSTGTLYGLVSGFNPGTSRIDDEIVSITRVQPSPPPPAGTVVYHTSVPMAAMPALDGYVHFDFGTWLPPYGGDFRIDVSRAGVDGGATNNVHVGPAALGELSALEPQLPPGDQNESMCLSLTGADFTSISRVETTQVRRLAFTGAERPYGMTGDKAGNLYFTGTSNLYKTDTGGRTTALASGMSLAFGLANDSAQNLYVGAWNPTKQHYELLKFDPSGNKTTVADLGVNSMHGVAVDSRDNVLVGTPGALLKVNPQGQISVVSHQGMTQPRGIAIDAYDNVYVQNEPGYVSQIRPDGSTTDVFVTNDSVNDPFFEGDNFPNIAGDCAENFYISPAKWAKLGPTFMTEQEEHAIVQIIPRTGQTSLVLDTLSIDPNIEDIDYIAYDRFGSRLLMYNHLPDSTIYQAPVTCGAIGVDAHVITASGQTISAPSVPASSVVARADGGKEYVWSLKDVTTSGRQVCFDTNLKGLKLGETRPTLAASYITFQNSFAPNDVQQALDVPVVHVANLVNLGVTTDQAEYAAQSTAQVTTTLSNTNPTVVQGTLVVNVVDAGGAFVGGVTRQDVSVPALGSLPLAAPFAIGTILPAQYTVTAVLSANGVAQAQGQTTFDVLPNNASASATSFVHTDKQSYNPNDTVTIASRAQSLSSNLVLGNLTLMITVLDANGAVQFTHGFPIVQLLPGATLDFSVPDKLVNAGAGIYTVKQDLLDDAGHVLNHVEAAYNVMSTSDTGFGLSGTIVATPKSLPVGQTLNLSASATNQGNAALSNLPLTIALLDPASGTVLQSFVQNANIGVGATQPLTATWAAQGAPGTTYFAVLSAAVGSGATAKTLTLAVDTYTLSAPAAHLDASVTLTATPPPLAALVLIDSDAPAAETARVAATLTSLGYVSTFATNANDFGNGVRTGAYQVYLLLAANVAPDATTQRLLREGVHRGEGVLLANGQPLLPDTLAAVAGLNVSSALASVDAQALDTLAAAPGGVAHEAFNPTLASRSISPTLAQTLATISARLSATPQTGTLTAELALYPRIDLAYTGSDSGTNGTHLALAALGRLRNADGTDRASVWRIRNSGTTARTLLLAATDGTYALTFTSQPQSDAYIASTDLSGGATHTLSEAGQAIQSAAAPTTAFADTRVIDAGDNPGAIALWANAIGVSDTLDWSGAQHTLHGAVHSNGDIRLSGAQNLIDGPLHYVTAFTNSGSQNTFTYPPRPVATQPLPTPFNLDDFKPGGAVALAAGKQYFDQTAECASKHQWQRSGSGVTLAAGVYWIPCDVHISGSSPSGNVTLVTSGNLQIDGSKGNFSAFWQGLQFASTRPGASAINLSGSNTQVGGLVYAPHGTATASGSSMNFSCGIIADQIRLAGARTTIDARQCAAATLQRTSPAVLWNAYGSGSAAYAAFDWQRAIGQYEASGSGVLTTLFKGVLAHVAPPSASLRAGTIVPLNAAVQNTADAFIGQLSLSANDDSTFLPATPVWALDFSARNTFSAQSNIRLGSGSGTGVTANVSAASPIVVSSVAKATTSLSHLPGESVATLIAAANAIANPDAALSAASVALQAAQASLAANDRNGAIGHLLDAAEACGNSGNAQADALRTRIDWVLWATTH